MDDSIDHKAAEKEVLDLFGVIVQEYLTNRMKPAFQHHPLGTSYVTTTTAAQ
jgi:hypothetical protein